MAAETTRPVDQVALVDVSTELVDLTDESLTALRTTGTSVLSHAVRRAIKDVGTSPEVSAAGFSAKF
jgi:hypothetical protein